MHIEVVYALPERQCLLSLAVPAGCTAAEAVRLSGMLSRFPEIEPETMQLGIFGERKGHDQPLREGDRVEIYRPLRIDPKKRRRQRAKAPR